MSRECELSLTALSPTIFQEVIEPYLAAEVKAARRKIED
jgi:hypothetical protein